MVHSGYEASAVDHTFGSLGGLWQTVKAMLHTTYADPDAVALLNEPAKPVHAFNPLVQIESPKTQMEENSRMSIPTHMNPHVEPGAGKFDPDQLEVAPGRQRETVEGWVPELATRRRTPPGA